jgi:ribosomal protein S18 acetylase RimI-like enzyme
MRITSLQLIVALILISLCTYTLYRFFSKEKRDTKLVQYIENYYSSMMPPQLQNPEVFVWFTALNIPTLNAITHFYYTTDIGTRIDAILEKAPQKPISFWVEEWQDSKDLVKELEARGFQKVVTCPFMSWKVSEIQKPSNTIKRRDQATADAFNTILGRGFGLDRETEQGYGALQNNSSAESYLIYTDDVPVGTGTLFITDNVGLILNITVLPEYQKKGFGSAITQFLMHRAYELNLEKVILNANPGAISVYQKLGFKHLYDLYIYAKA